MNAIEPISWQDESVSRVILGTVQLGMPYGIANRTGQPDPREAARIIEAAWAGGIRHFDTAQAYGNSELVLGQALRDTGLLGEACIGSKLAISMDPREEKAVRASIEQTFTQLGTDRIWYMLLHRPYWLDAWDDGLGAILLEEQAKGRIQHLGVSFNTPREGPQYQKHPHMTILQFAANAWDRRAIQEGIFSTALEIGQLCCVRSIYLQGLLTLAPEEAAKRLPAAEPAARAWRTCADQCQIAPTVLAVRYALTFNAPLVVGAESPGQIRETLSWIQDGPLDKSLVEEINVHMAPHLFDDLVTPSQWNSLPIQDKQG